MLSKLLDPLLFALRIFMPFLAIVISWQGFSSMRSQRRGDRPLIMLWNNITKSNLIHRVMSDGVIPAIILLKDKVEVDAKGKDVLNFANLVIETVKEKFGVQLEIEAHLIK